MYMFSSLIFSLGNLNQSVNDRNVTTNVNAWYPCSLYPVYLTNKPLPSPSSFLPFFVVVAMMKRINVDQTPIAPNANNASNAPEECTQGMQTMQTMQCDIGTPDSRSTSSVARSSVCGYIPSASYHQALY
mmetsp:Transcript_14879/g.25812  ORF Transcript_14879/g.25812 Transcript_14879/m.25812 type:complete len:130 (+) Transcript_14879:2580-2969(+)